MPGMGHGCGFHAHGALWQVAAEGQVTRKQGKYMRQLGEVAGGQPGEPQGAPRRMFPWEPVSQLLSQGAGASGHGVQ